MQTATGVGCTGSASNKADTRSAGEFAVGFRHIGCAAFVATDDEFDLAAIVESIQRGEVGFTGYAKDAFDRVDSKRVDQSFGAASRLRLFGQGGLVATRYR